MHILLTSVELLSQYVLSTMYGHGLSSLLLLLLLRLAEGGTLHILVLHSGCATSSRLTPALNPASLAAEMINNRLG